MNVITLIMCKVYLEHTGWYHHAVFNTTAVTNAMIKKKTMDGSMQTKWSVCIALKHRSIENSLIIASTAKLTTKEL